MKTIFILIVLAVSALIPNILAANYVVDGEFQGGSGDPAFGDMFGNAIELVPKKESGRSTTLSIIGAVFGDGYKFPNGSAMVDAGRVYFYERTYDKDWSQFQDQYVGQSANNQAGGGVAGGLLKTKGCSHKHGDGWLFIPEPGTPLNVSDLSKKDFSGSIGVFKMNSDGQYEFKQRIYNPAGNGEDQIDAEIGISLDYSNGWLITGGGVTNTAWLFSYDDDTEQWLPRQNITTGTDKGNMIVAIGGDYAFVQVAIAPYNFPANDEILVYRKTGPLAWTRQQSLVGYGNTGSNEGTIGDLLGSTMTIGGKHNRWAIIGAPGDGTFAGTSGYKAAGAVYFAYLQDNGTWTITQKDYSDEPTLYYGLGTSISDKNVAYVADAGRTVGSNQFQGALREYTLVDGTWTKGALLTDPNGRAYDLLGISTTADKYVQGGTFRFAFNFLPPLNFTVPPLPGRSVIWKQV